MLNLDLIVLTPIRHQCKQNYANTRNTHHTSRFGGALKIFCLFVFWKPENAPPLTQTFRELGPKPPIPPAIWGVHLMQTAAQHAEEGGSAGQTGRMTGRSFSNGRLHKACTPQIQPAFTFAPFAVRSERVTSRHELGAHILGTTCENKGGCVNRRAKREHVKAKSTTV